MFSSVEFAQKREHLLAGLKREGYVRSPAVERAFRNVPRERFLEIKRHAMAYIDTPQPILEGQTMSAPSMIAIMLEAAGLESGNRVLEVGTGSGYNAALLAEIVGAENVVTIERHDALVEWGRGNLQAAGYGAVTVVHGDGSQGWPEGHPYDRIMATAGSPRIPESWIAQLREGGRIIAPIGPGTYEQTLIVGIKKGGRLKTRQDVACAFVPLIGKEGWKGF